MIRKSAIEGKSASAYVEVERILYENKDFYMTKEEIYARMPVDEEGIPLVSIGSLESALRAFCRTRAIECEYIRGRRHFAYREARERR
jgi:hypothetical protein